MLFDADILQQRRNAIIEFSHGVVLPWIMLQLFFAFIVLIPFKMDNLITNVWYDIIAMDMKLICYEGVQ